MRLLGLAVLTAVSCFSADLFRDDFSHFPPGWLTSPVGTLNGAIEEGKSYLEEQLDSAACQWTPPIVISGDPSGVTTASR